MTTENTNETVSSTPVSTTESVTRSLMKEVSEKVELASKSVKDKVVEMLADKQIVCFMM